MSSRSTTGGSPARQRREARDAATGIAILGSGLTALGVVRSAHRLGLRPIVIDVEEGPATASRLPRKLVFAGADRNTLAGELERLGKGERASLISTTDAWLRVIRAHRETLEGAFAAILHPANGVLDICLNKGSFADWCRENNVPAPHRYDLGSEQLDIPEDIHFPVMLRPGRTLHSNPVPGIAKATEIDTADSLRRELAKFRAAGVEPIVVESLLARPLTQYSVGFARSSGGIETVVARKLRPPPEACTLGTLVEAVDEPRVRALAVRVVELLDFMGIGEVEVLRDESSDEDYVIEVNARPWMQFTLAVGCGRDLLGFVLDHRDAGPDPGNNARVWIDFLSDLYVCFNREAGLVRHGRLRWRDYLASIARANIHSRWAMHDPAPFLKDAGTLLLARFRRLLGRPRRDSPP